MTAEVLVGIITAAIYAYLMYQQNVILREQNRIMREQAGTAVATTETSRYRRYWPMLTMGFLTLVTWGAVGVYFYEARQTAAHRDCRQWQSTEMETIYGRSYVDERVEMDGKKFDHCHFKNVTLVFSGLSPSDCVYCSFEGEFNVENNNIPANAFHRMMRVIDQSPGLSKVQVFTRDEHGNLILTCPHSSRTESYDTLRLRVCG